MNPGVHLVTIVKVRKNSDWRRLRPLHVINDNSYCRALLRMTAYPPYGYDNVDGKMVIVPEEAAGVKEIFSWALSGKDSHIIANTLNERGIASKRGAKWHASTVQGILKNEKYTGDVIFQKTFTDERFNRHTNYGEKNMYLCKEHHEAIVTHEIFDKVAETMNRRGQEKGQGEDTGKYQNRYAFSGRIICGECGSSFKRRNHYKPSGNYIAWSCNGHLKDKDSCRMLFCRKQSPQTLLKKRELRMMARFHNTTLLEARRRLFIETCSPRCKKNFLEDLTCIAMVVKEKESIPASTL